MFKTLTLIAVFNLLICSIICSPINKNPSMVEPSNEAASMDTTNTDDTIPYDPTFGTNEMVPIQEDEPFLDPSKNHFAQIS